MLSDARTACAPRKVRGEPRPERQSAGHVFPTAVTIASSWDPGLIEEVGRAVGAEARALGCPWSLGPGLNIKRHPLCGRNFEYLSEDPLLSGHLATAMVRGIQESGLGPA